MAAPTIELIRALRTTAARLEAGETFQWSHFANCNCGHLARTLTGMDPKLIYRAAFQRAGDWGEQALEYCPSSGLPMDHIFEEMLAVGLEVRDIGHLERLNDPEVLRSLPEGKRSPRYTVREDAICYMRAWADLLEAKLPERRDGERRPEELASTTGTTGHEAA